MKTIVMLDCPVPDIAQILAEAHEALGEIPAKSATLEQKRAYRRCTTAIREIKLQKRKVQYRCLTKA